MSAPGFESLDKFKIAIDMEIGGRRVQFSGIAAYERLTDLGPVLKIHVADPAGNFDLILREEQWKGKIVEDRQSGCDFRISLASSDLVPQSS